MKNFLTVISRAKESLDSILLEGSKPPSADLSQDPTQRLFTSIIEFTKINKGQKWLSNFEVAAMHLSVHLKVCLSITGLNSTKKLAI